MNAGRSHTLHQAQGSRSQALADLETQASSLLSRTEAWSQQSTESLSIVQMSNGHIGHLAN
jgi:hypothetical protein